MTNFILPPYGRKLTFNFVKDIVLSNPYIDLVILELGMTSTVGFWDGISFLSGWGKDIRKPIDVLYLDAWDYGEGDPNR